MLYNISNLLMISRFPFSKHALTTRVNFYNDDDYALFTGPFAMWEGNQSLFKPDHSITAAGGSYSSYSFDGVNCSLDVSQSHPDGGQQIVYSRTITEDFEKKAFVAGSRSKAVGAAGLKYSPFTLTGGVIGLNVSLQDPNRGFVNNFAFGNTRPDHSGEFQRPIQTVLPFYRQLLQTAFSIGPKL